MKPLWAEADRLQEERERAAAEEKRRRQEAERKPVAVIRGGEVTTPFGAKAINPATGRSYWIAGQHPGDDWNTPGREDAGKPCRSAVSGRVVGGNWGPAFGKHVIVEADDGTRTAHCHLRAKTVQVGDTVEAGQGVGIVGATGNVTAPHVHVERREAPFGYWNHIRPIYERVQGG